MEKKSEVAEFINTQIKHTGKSQKDIAREAGFEMPNVITMIKQGKTKLPIAKIGPMANALKTDPVQLFRMCFYEYFPETWQAIAPFMETAFTDDERRLVSAIRHATGATHIAALSAESKVHLDKFINSLRTSSAIH